MKGIRGFTLLELMITVSIVGILAVIAYQSYDKQMVKGRRAAAQAVMMDIAQKEQQILLDQRSYSATITTCNDMSTLSITVPAEVTKFYCITVASAVGPPPTFTVTATAVGRQLSDGNLTLSNTGQKTPSTKW